MNYLVDVDEADVAVLNQNLTKLKELFDAILRSLHTIASRLAHATTDIKPVLADVARLNRQKSQIVEGLELLKDMSQTAAVINGYEEILGQPVDQAGLRKYISTVGEAKQLFVDVKPKLKRFTNVLISFETLIDKAEIKLQTYFQQLIRADAKVIIDDPTKTKDTKTILGYFAQGGPSGNDKRLVDEIFVSGRRDMLYDRQLALAPSCVPTPRPANIPYERGSNGINRFNNEFIRGVKDEMALMEHLGMGQGQTEMAREVVERTVVEVYTKRVLGEYNKFFDPPGAVAANDLLVLEVVENLLHFQKFLTNYGLSVPQFDTAVLRFVGTALGLFKEYFRLIEARFAQAQNLNDQTIPQICVDLISKIRRVLETRDALVRMIATYKLGDWLVLTPPAKFVSVYSLLIPHLGDDTAPDYLLSLYFSDLIDAMMINIELGLRKHEGLKKSTQGFWLVKNLVMVETIINKLPSLYQCLGLLGMERLNKLKNRFLKLFLDDWNLALYIIIRDMTLIATTLAHQGGSKLGSTGGATTHVSLKEKEQIKELFRAFNELFEEALDNYSKYNITDTNLRSYLATEIKKLITLAYFKLYDKCGTLDFTKNRSKYVKYDKQQFERLLNDKL